MNRLRIVAPIVGAWLLIAAGAGAQETPTTAPEGAAEAEESEQSAAAPEESSEVADAETEEVGPDALPPLNEALTGIARAEYEAAKILYQDGDYQGALNKLQVAFENSQDPRLLWNMAAAQKNLRHYARVIQLMDEYLAAGEPYVTKADEAKARALIDTVTGFVSEVTVQVEPAGAEISVDGETVGTAPLARPLVLDFGKRSFAVSMVGYVPHQQELELQGGEKRTLEVALAREVNEGQLKIVSDTNATIRVDGRVVGVGLWEGQLTAGAHTVQIEAPGKVPVTTEVVVGKGQARVVNQPLRDEATKKKRLPAWAWITGGVVTAAAVGAGTYFAVRGGEETPPPQPGTWNTLEF